ncbi:hypothetical protein [Desulfuromonas acetoxidans]|uniref:hypothetical protein n=1 Tax=Desulfuromonas acetoxidans TaxID=891 RepID=UPI002931375D|nr:hypothetical protein [Desulfuromonas acetoxidans]
MSKKSKNKSRQKQKKKSRSKRQKKTSTNQSMSFGKTVSKGILTGWSGIVGLSVIVSVLGFAFLIYPRLSIAPGQTIEKLNPFYTPFILENDGYLPIRDISFTCGLGSVILQNSDKPNFSNFGIQIAGTEIPNLRPGKKTSIPFNRVFSKDMPIKSADITVIVSYKSSWLPISFTDTQSFKTSLNYSGELVWTPNDGRIN